MKGQGASGGKERTKAAFAGSQESWDHVVQVLPMLNEDLLIQAARAYVSCGKTL